MDTQADWIIHSTGAAILALLWFFFTKDRVANDKRLQQLESENRDQSEELARVDERHKNLKTDIDELKASYFDLDRKIGNAIRRR